MREENERTEVQKRLMVKATAYCARGERAPKAVEEKLWAWGAGITDEVMVAEIMEYLYQEKYLDEYRYAEAYVNDKLRFLKKGPLLLRAELRTKGIAEKAIKVATSKIAEEEWYSALRSYLGKKEGGYRKKSADHYELRARLLAAAQQRGYPQSVALNVVEDMLIK